MSYMDGDMPNAAQLDVKDAEHAKGNNAQSADVAVPPGEDVVPMVFKWEHGGRNVFITGTFNGWDKQCPMHRSGNDFTYIANLTRGKHMYKFVVDDDWRFAPDQLTMADVEGNVNNYVDVSDFAPLSDFDGKKPQDDDEDPENPYSRYIPEIDEYTKEPPPLPPHLRHIILNKSSPPPSTHETTRRHEQRKNNKHIFVFFSSSSSGNSSATGPRVYFNLTTDCPASCSSPPTRALVPTKTAYRSLLSVLLSSPPSIAGTSLSLSRRAAGWAETGRTGACLYVDLGPEEEEERAEAQQQSGDEGEHQLHQRVLLGGHGAREEERHEDQPREQQRHREEAVALRVHGARVRDFLQPTEGDEGQQLHTMHTGVGTALLGARTGKTRTISIVAAEYRDLRE
ncbi:hypothetical protein ON010_g15636 [Phytophthora cinnamomi]|nr:hypothetical protein ON010_g15636 [Phytophthora cinnamomi]